MTSVTGKTQSQVDAAKAAAEQAQKVAKARQYLAQTDWQEWRFGSDLYPEVAKKRAAARATITASAALPSSKTK